jgi:phosphatidylglycerophosphate synthase
MAEIGQRATVNVSQLAKWKTAFQMVSIGLLLYRDDLFGIPVNSLGYGLLYIAALLTLWSMVNYLKAALIAIAKT